jgi:HlyD family secretion protein
MSRRWLLTGVSVLAMGCVAGGLALWRRQTAGPPAVDAKTPETDVLPAEITVPGQVHARSVVAVGPQVSGVVEAFLADVGQEVFEGQLLARIRSQGLEAARQIALESQQSAQAKVSSLEAAIIAARLEASRARADASRARGDLERSEKVYSRQRLLHSEGATPRLTFEKAEREHEVAESEFRSLDELARQAEARAAQLVQELQRAKTILEQKNNDLERAGADLLAAEVHSPVNGLVIARRGEPGLETGPQDTDLFQIATNLAALAVAIDLPGEAAKRVSIGTPALVVVADVPGEAIEGTVAELHGARALVDFTNPSGALKPGTTAQVRVKLDPVPRVRPAAH